MSDFITISRQQALSILIEIAELRSQVTDLTRNRDYFREQRDELRAELEAAQKAGAE